MLLKQRDIPHRQFRPRPIERPLLERQTEIAGIERQTAHRRELRAHEIREPALLDGRRHREAAPQQQQGLPGHAGKSAESQYLAPARAPEHQRQRRQHGDAALEARRAELEESDARRQQRFGLGWNGLVLPVELAAWAERARPPARLLNHLAFGGYLMWALDEPVFIDSRLEVVGEEFFATYLRALASPAGLDPVVERYGVRWIALPYRLRPDTTAGLSRHPAWRLAYVDGVAAAFVRADAVRESMIDPSAPSSTRWRRPNLRRR